MTWLFVGAVIAFWIFKRAFLNNLTFMTFKNTYVGARERGNDEKSSLKIALNEFRDRRLFSALSDDDILFLSGHFAQNENGAFVLGNLLQQIRLNRIAFNVLKDREAIKKLYPAGKAHPQLLSRLKQPF